MVKNKTLVLESVSVALLEHLDTDFISLTDIAKVKNSSEAKDVVKNWLRSRSTIEFLGLWEKINNSQFKGVEFDAFKLEAGTNSFTLSPTKWIEATDAIAQNLMPLNLSKLHTGLIFASEADVLNVALFGMTVKQWRDNNNGKAGNIRDHAAVEQLVVLSNLESLNAELIRQDLHQPARLTALNQTAIHQMRSLLGAPSLKKLK